MPYDAGASIWSVPILDASGNPTGSFSAAPIQWDAQGRPFRRQVNGQPAYVAPAEAINDRDPRVKAWGQAQTAAAPSRGGFTDKSSTWNSQTGQWDKGSFWNSPIGGLVLGGAALGGPLAASALGAGGGAGTGAVVPSVGNSVSAIGNIGALAPGVAPSAAGTAALTAADVPLTAGLAGTGLEPALAATQIGSGAMSGLPAGVPSGTSFSSVVGGGGGGGGGAPGPMSWLTSPTASLINTGLNIGGQLFGAKMASDASERAAQIQAEEYDKALAAEKEQRDYERGQRAEFIQRTQPYQTTGTAAQQRVAQLLGLK